MKLVLSLLFLAVVLPQIAALILCGPIGFSIVGTYIFVAVLFIWNLWKNAQLWRGKHYLLCCIALFALGLVAWFAVPRLTFQQAQELVCAMPENASAEVVTQNWSQQLISSGPSTAKSPLLGKSYFVIVSEGDVTRSYFVNPLHGTVFKNPG